MSQTEKGLILAIIAIVFAVGGYFVWQNNLSEEPVVTTDVKQIETTTALPSNTNINLEVIEPESLVRESDEIIENNSTITIMVPEDYELYKKEMTKFVQEGGLDPLTYFKFEEKVLNITNTSDLIKASAQASAEEIPPSGGPAKASIVYLEVESKTAYIQLDIDLDGWAGSSVSLAIIHPLVEKTLFN